VLIGFLTGVGIHVALGQVSGMLGLTGGGHGTMDRVWADVQQIEQINVHALAIAIAVLAVTVGAQRLSKRIPGALIAVIAAIALSWTLDLEQYVRVLGPIPSGLPHIGLPQVDWSLHLMTRLVPTAFAMFVVIPAQSAATSRAYAARYNERFSEDTDLVGLAAANIAESRRSATGGRASAGSSLAAPRHLPRPGRGRGRRREVHQAIAACGSHELTAGAGCLGVGVDVGVADPARLQGLAVCARGAHRDDVTRLHPGRRAQD